jgi:hypothetical protein
MYETAKTLGMVILCAFFFVLCDTLSAHWGKTGNKTSLVLVILFAPIGYLIFGYINHNHPLSLSGGWVNVMIAIATVCVGTFGFGEKIAHRHKFGFVLALVSLILLLT